MRESRGRTSLLLVAAALLLVSGVGAGEARAQKLHALIVTDQSEWAGWGQYAPNVVADATNVFAMLFNNVPAEQLVFSTLPIEERGSPKLVMDAVADLQPGPRDAVLFYYSGHGGSDDRGHYFDLEGGKLYRSQVRKALEAKRPRLAVLLTDCCSVRGDGRAYMAPMPDLQEPRAVTPVFRSLFFQPRGTVDVNASAPGDSAFFHVWRNRMQPPEGSLFTATLTEFVKENQGRTPTWDRLLGIVGPRVRLAFRDDYPKGAAGAKGQAVQKQQNVYAYDYPGMPEESGPRTGVTVRDTGGRGALIIASRADFPSGRVVDVASRKVTALRTGTTIVEANGTRVTGAQDFAKIVRASKDRILRLRVRGPQGTRDYLMQLRY